MRGEQKHGMVPSTGGWHGLSTTADPTFLNLFNPVGLLTTNIMLPSLTGSKCSNFMPTNDRVGLWQLWNQTGLAYGARCKAG